MLLDNTTLLKVGTTPYTKVFQGATQIWPKVVSGAYTPNPINNSTAALPLPTTGTNYFISNLGNVNNSGLSESSPWPLSKVQQGYNVSSPFVNANILFKAGETFYGNVYIWANGTTRYQSYGDGPRPIITTMRIVPGSTVPSNWIQHSIYPNVWGLDVSGLQFRPRIWLNDVESTRAKFPSNVDIDHRVGYSNDNTDGQRIWVYATSNPTTFYSSIKSPNFDASTMNIELSTVFIKNLDIRGAKDSCISAVSTATGSVIEDCIIGLDSVGSAVTFSNVDGVEIKNNDFKTGFKTAFYNFGDEGGDCIAVYARNNLRNINVHHNNFYDWIHSSFWVEQQGGAAYQLVNIQFRNNYCTAPNLYYGRGFGCYGYFGTTVDNSIYVENNVFYKFTVASQIACPGLYVRYNTIDTQTNSILDGSHVTGSAYGINVGYGSGFGQAYLPQGMNVTFNTIKNCEQSGLDLEGRLNYVDAPYQTIMNNIFSNNTFQNNGTNPQNPWYETTRTPAGVDIMHRARPEIHNNTFQNNVFDGRLASDKCIFYGNAVTGDHTGDNSFYLKTTSEFNAMNGTAGDVISGNSITLT